MLRSELNYSYVQRVYVFAATATAAATTATVWPANFHRLRGRENELNTQSARN